MAHPFGVRRALLIARKASCRIRPIYLLCRAWDPSSLPSDLFPGRPERSPALYSSPQQPLAGFFFALRRFHAFDSIPAHTTKLLIAAQWALTGFGLFCLVGAAVVIALTPEAWPSEHSARIAEQDF
jgi:hypothetical protein